MSPSQSLAFGQGFYQKQVSLDKDSSMADCNRAASCVLAGAQACKDAAYQQVGHRALCLSCLLCRLAVFRRVILFGGKKSAHIYVVINIWPKEELKYQRRRCWSNIVLPFYSISHMTKNVDRHISDITDLVMLIE